LKKTLNQLNITKFNRIKPPKKKIDPQLMKVSMILMNQPPNTFVIRSYKDTKGSINLRDAP